MARTIVLDRTLDRLNFALKKKPFLKKRLQLILKWQQRFVKNRCTYTQTTYNQTVSLFWDNYHHVKDLIYKNDTEIRKAKEILELY